jgi:hypothetical protein
MFVTKSGMMGAKKYCLLELETVTVSCNITVNRTQLGGSIEMKREEDFGY